MKARWRVLVAATAVLLTAGAPALAQETAPPAQNDVIGPPQLQDFSLNGTVTREAPAPAPVQAQPAPRQTDRAAPATGGTSQAATSPPPQASRDSTVTAARAAPGSSEAVAGAPDLPPPTPAPRIPPPAVTASADASALSPQPGFVPETVGSSMEPSGNPFPLFPWLVAALALAGAAAWYFLRQRPRESLAGAGGIDLFEAPSPAQPAARPVPAPAPPAPGFVSTRLRPWLEIEFAPLRAILDEEKAAIEFHITVLNSGSVPARDVLLEGALFNAGPMQDQQIRMFFENPLAKGDRVPLIAPMQKVSVNTAVFLPRDQIRPLEVEGRLLFVPMVAFNVLYGWGGGEGQSSVSHLVGKATRTDKLAPFRLDLGPRVFRNLDSREHELRSRK